jgi:hydroxymethylbilane synthase
VGTRLGKLEAGEFDALVLASAGLRRLELAHRVSEYLDVEDSLPAAGQGALGIECLADAVDVQTLIAPLNDLEVSACVGAEREVSAGLGADCSAPLGAHAVLDGGTLHLRALLASPDGTKVLRAGAVGADSRAVGAEVVAALRAQGAMALLDSLDLP